MLTNRMEKEHAGFFPEKSVPEALDLLREIDEPVVSIYFPFAVQGNLKDKLRIARKNLLKNLKDTLLNHGYEDHLVELQLQSTHEEGLTTVDQNHQTVAYFFNKNFCLQCRLPGLVYPHFCFQQIPDLEPLIYVDWMSEPYTVLDLDPDGPQLYQGKGYQIEEVHVPVSQFLSEVAGNELKTATLERLNTRLDREDPARTGKEMSPANTHYGLASTGKSPEDKNIAFWVKKVAEIINPHLPQHQDNHFFLIASDKVARFFFETVQEARHIPKENMISALPKSQDNLSQISEWIVPQLTDKKLIECDREIPDTRLEPVHVNILKHLQKGNVSSIIIKRDPEFNNIHRVDYKISLSSREEVLTKALRKDVPICYIDHWLKDRYEMAATLQ